MKKTQVVDGVRGAANSTAAEDTDHHHPAPIPRIQFADEGEKPSFPTRFQSACGHFVLTLNIPQRMPDGSMRDNKFNVVFDRGFVDITTKRFPFAPDKVSEALQKCSGYGLGKSFWDADAYTEQYDQKHVEDVAAQIQALNPEQRAALKAQFADDFDLPKAAPAAE